MKRVLLALSLAAAVAVAASGVVALAHPAEPQASCLLPTPPPPCMDNSQCTSPGTACDTTAGQCICVVDGGVDAGAIDLGNSDGGGGSGGGGGGGGSVGQPGVPPSVGGGAETSPRGNGCSFAPGRAY